MTYAIDLLYVIGLLLYAPFLGYRAWRTGRYREGWAEKLFGSAPLRVGDDPCIWFHAVSVGEVMLLRPIIAELARRRPGWQIVLSTTTSTGLAVARKEYPDLVTFYVPLDFSWAARRAVARIRPTVLALVELEIWPNLIWFVKRSGARVAVINGRLSSRSHKGYRKLRKPLARTFGRLDVVAVQTQEYADRFVDLGVPRPHVHVTGSVKYDGLECDRNNSRTLSLRRELGLNPADLLFVAGSTMEGEEAAALSAYRRARARHPRLRLILVPRHAERFDDVCAWLESQGERVVRRSCPHAVAGKGTDPPVIVVDTLGELSAVWGLADVAFVGGSLFPGRNGQNMMEAAAYGAAVLFGPYTSNFRDAVDGLLAHHGARRVQDPDDLSQALLDDLADPESAVLRGSAGRAYVRAQEGASERTIAELDRLVGHAA
jgi:3-deoxy-D-manno-octulosonic-acid transferase